MPTQQELPARQTAGTTRRLFYVDNVRVALMILVVLHHLASTYGTRPGWYYQELTADPSALPLDFLVTVNASFLMGLFFLISATFIPGSYERKRTGKFLRDRLLRLGVPYLLFYFVLSPIAWIGILYGPYAGTVTTQTFWQYYLDTISAGPLWFVEVLLIFTICYVVWRRLAGTPRSPARQRMLGYRAVIMFTVGLAVVTFLWRMVVPVGFYIPYLWLPSASHLPQYISMFVIGLVAVRRGWLTSLPPALGRWGLAAALAGALVLYRVSLVGGQDAAGGANVTSLLFSLLEAVVCVGVCLGVFTLFRQHFNSMGRWGAFLSQHAYAVFVTHAPVVVCVGIALRGVTLPPIVKFAIAVVLAVPLCFLIAAAVRKIPGARKVL